MKNIQERAREYADRHKAEEIVGKVYGYERIYNAEMAAYERGATDQKAIDDTLLLKLKSSWEEEAQINHNDESNYKQGYHDAVEKACELIEKALQKLTTYKDKDNFTENEFKIITASQIPNWLIKFRKVMEE